MISIKINTRMLKRNIQLKAYTSKEKDNKYNDKYEFGKKTEYDESKIKLDNQEKVDGTNVKIKVKSLSH